MSDNDIQKPDIVTEDHLKYLDSLRRTGIVNMFGSIPYLTNAFENLNKVQAKEILMYWMNTFSERHPEE